MWRWQDCVDDNGWLDVASTIVLVNGRHFLILLYSILICIVLWCGLELFSSLFFRSFQFEEEEEEQKVPSTLVAKYSLVAGTNEGFSSISEPWVKIVVRSGHVKGGWWLDGWLESFVLMWEHEVEWGSGCGVNWLLQIWNILAGANNPSWEWNNFETWQPET